MHPDVQGRVLPYTWRTLQNPIAPSPIAHDGPFSKPLAFRFRVLQYGSNRGVYPLWFCFIFFRKIFSSIFSFYKRDKKVKMAKKFILKLQEGGNK